MGMRTTIYGCIEEMDFWNEPIMSEVKRHNKTIIDSLPLMDQWPPLSIEMFSFCENTPGTDPTPNLEYSGRIIHFGANLKSVESEWKEWRTKFESLLSKLFWLEAHVHFKTEYGELQSFTWRIDLLKYKIAHNDEMPAPIKSTDWDFSGPVW